MAVNSKNFNTSRYSLEVNKNNRMSVLVLAFNRPQLVRQLLRTLPRHEISSIYISIDGPRNSIDAEKADEIVGIAEEFSRTNSVKVRRGKNNLGCRLGVIAGLDWFFNEVEEGLILEDDCLPEIELFEFLYCNKYKLESGEVAMISAHNPLGKIEFLDYKSRFVFINGWFMQSNVWRDLRHSMFHIKPPSRFSKTANPRSLSESIFWWAAYARARIGIHDTWDSLFYRAFSFKGYLCLVPGRNLIQNLGFGENATHTTNPDGSILLKNGPKLAEKTKSSAELDSIIATSYFNISKRHAITPFIKVGLDFLKVRHFPDFEKQLRESKSEFIDLRELNS
jgi:hypothetical protein